jgi:hypothetical protein
MGAWPASASSDGSLPFWRRISLGAVGSSRRTRKAPFDYDVLTLNKARFFQTFTESGHELRRVAGRPGVEEPHHRHRQLLLRARRERPSRCAAEERDEIATAAHVWMAPAWQEKM